MPLLVQIKQDFEQWALLNLSVAARINSVEMNFSPQPNYTYSYKWDWR